jgi:hypothetical protein
MKALPSLLGKLAALATAALLLLAPALASAQPAEAAPAAPVADDYDYQVDTDPSTIDDFRPRLAPYGYWVEDERYGTVWVPNRSVVGADFVPYRTSGHWAVANDGQWVWVSDYDWGYIPFHYGRWVYGSQRGWVWVPGRVYAPAWVIWRVGEPGYDYVGWAPMPPAYVWFGGIAVGFAYAVTVPWWFCPSVYLFDPYWHHHVIYQHHHVHDLVAHSHVHGGHHGGHHAGGGHVKATGVADGSSGGHAGASDGGGSAGSAGADKAAGAARGASSGGVAASPDNLKVSGRPISPSFEAARIPPQAIPKTRVQHDQRALSLRKPSPSKAKSALGAAKPPASRAVTATRSPGASFPTIGRDGSSRGWRAPRLDAPRASGSTSATMPRRSYPAPGARVPSGSGRTLPYTYGKPPSRSHGAPSRSYHAPSPSRSYGTPSRSYHAPSPSRSYGTPSRSYHAPSPSRSYSAPSRSHSSGSSSRRSSGSSSSHSGSSRSRGHR